MDEARTFECPSCGGELTTDGLSSTLQCPYCGQTVTVPRDMRIEPAPEEPHHPAPVVYPDRPAERAPARRGGGCGCGPFLFAALLILAVLVGGAVLSGNGSELVRLLDAASGATPTPLPVHRVLSATLPRSLRYAGVVLTVNRAEMTNQDPNASSGARYRSDRMYAILSVKLDNTNGDREVGLPYSAPRLELGDGSQYQPEGSFAFDVASAATRQGQFLFIVPTSANWNGAKLVVREPGKEPALLPLDGTPAKPQQAIDLKVATEMATGTVLYRVLGATLDTARDGQQVDAGKRYLRFDMRVVNNGKEPGGVAVSGGNFRLLLDGDSLAPDESLIEAIPPLSKVDGNVDFTVPAGTKAATLQVGELNGPKARILVNLAP